MNRIPASFEDFALLCYQLEKTASRNTRAAHLGVFFSSYDTKSIVASVYLLQGLLRQQFIPTSIGISEKLALEALAQLSNKDTQTILSLFHIHGDLGTVAELLSEELVHEINNHTSLAYIRSSLIDFTSIQGTGSQEKKQNLILKLMHDLSPLGRKYFIRIVVGKLRLGVSDSTVIKGLCSAYKLTKLEEKKLDHAYSLQSDLGALAQNLSENGPALLDTFKTPQLHTPLQPASAERLLDAEHIVSKLGIPCIAQPKYDGLRVQIHIETNKNVITMFSRNVLPMHQMFPELCKVMHDICVKNNIVNGIFDGEIMGFDKVLGQYKSFQETAKRRRKHEIANQNEEQHVRLIIFDCLFLNDISCLEMPCFKRLDLIRFFNDDSAQIISISSVMIENIHDLTSYFMHHTKQGHEGIMIKKYDSPYYVGERTYAWIKWKRTQPTEASDSIDAVILGYYYGKGKRTKLGIGALLAALYNKERDCFQTIAKVGTGLDEETWETIKKQCDCEKTLDIPMNSMCKKSLYPDVWCNPKLVISIQADELTRSSEHTADIDEGEGKGLALRFPRLLALRYDKNPYQTTTVEELHTIYQERSLPST